MALSLKDGKLCGKYFNSSRKIFLCGWSLTYRKTVFKNSQIKNKQTDRQTKNPRPPQTNYFC